LPLAIGVAVATVGLFYLLFTAAVYHAVPWPYIAAESRVRDLTAPGLLGLLLPPVWTVIIVSSAAVALIKDLPAMLLAVSRLMFAWAQDGIFPAAVSAVHPTFRTPHVAVLASAGMGTLGVIGSHLAGDFFLGVDILVTSMLVNFLLMAAAVLALPSRNAALARAVTVLPSRSTQAPLALAGILALSLFLAVHTWRDLTMPVAAWYFRSTPVWALVMVIGTMIYLRERAALIRRGVDIRARFRELPPE
jgi:amino acid transporter